MQCNDMEYIRTIDSKLTSLIQTTEYRIWGISTSRVQRKQQFQGLNDGIFASQQWIDYSATRLTFCISTIALCWGTGCNNNVECMAPPPELAIQIMEGALTYPADLDTVARVKVSYQENDQQKYVTDLVRMKDVFLASMLIQESSKANDPEFSFELNGRVLAKMKMETYINKTKCGDWANISKVYHNGEVVPRSINGAYLLK